MTYTRFLRYERLPMICYYSSRIGHIQTKCFYQPQDISPIEISCDEWIMAAIDPLCLHWSSDLKNTHTKSSLRNLNHITNLLLGTNCMDVQHFPDGTANSAMQTFEDDDVATNEPSAPLTWDVMSGSRVKSMIQHLDFQNPCLALNPYVNNLMSPHSMNNPSLSTNFNVLG